MNPKKSVPAKLAAIASTRMDRDERLNDLTTEQRRLALMMVRKLGSAIQIELPFAYVEEDGKRYYSLSAKRGAVRVDLVVTTDIPK